MSLEIWHNPRCSKSRETLALLVERGLEPRVIKYLNDPPTTERLQEVLDMLRMQPRELVRKNEDDYKRLALDQPEVSNDTILAAMNQSPRLIERPIVIKGNRAVVGRPPQAVLTLFDD